uniref:Uncharacterized protein n=1 Tax=Ciona savignyi TaxID=51511 RepID=H2Y527_CIOSA
MLFLKLACILSLCACLTSALVCNDGYQIITKKSWVLKYLPGTYKNKEVVCPASLGTPACMRVEASGWKVFLWSYKAKGSGALYECISRQQCHNIERQCEKKLREIINDSRFDSVHVSSCRMRCCYTNNCNNQPL